MKRLSEISRSGHSSQGTWWWLSLLVLGAGAGVLWATNGLLQTELPDQQLASPNHGALTTSNRGVFTAALKKTLPARLQAQVPSSRWDEPRQENPQASVSDSPNAPQQQQQPAAVRAPWLGSTITNRGATVAQLSDQEEVREPEAESREQGAESREQGPNRSALTAAGQTAVAPAEGTEVFDESERARAVTRRLGELIAVRPSQNSTSVKIVQFEQEDSLPIAFQEPAQPGADPFEVIDASGELEVTVRRSKMLRTRFDIYRTAVVDPTICDVIQFTPREISIIGKGQGATHVTFWFKNGQHRPLTYLVTVQPDPQERLEHERRFKILEELLAEHFPDSKVYLVPVADKLIVKGQAKDSEEAAQIMGIVRGQVQGQRGGQSGLGGGTAAQVLTQRETGRPAWPRVQVINMLRVPGVQQVALRVKIAELNRSAARGFGVNLDMQFNLGRGSALFLNSLLNSVSGGATSILGEFDGDDIQFGIRFLQEQGVLRLLSEPTLVTMSGRAATFVAGGEFAVPTVVGTAGLNAVTTDFRSFGVIISFLPTVIDKDRIRLQVAPEFSQLNSDLDVGGTLGLDVRAVTTTVEMREGQTLAIAGLLDESFTANRTSNLPWIGHLLGRRDNTRNETELIILVTPELVHPMEPEEVPPLPGFDVTEPTNSEFYWAGRLEGEPTRNYRSTIWPRLRRRYQSGGPAWISGPFGHGQ